MPDDAYLLAREWEVLRTVGDPMAEGVLAAAYPWEAYRAAIAYGPFLDDVDLPNGGGLYVTWAELTDVFETGKTDEAVAYAILRTAASDWLNRPAEQSTEWIEGWIAKARELAAAQFRKDGDFWRGPSA